jgi:hypothetical protein
MPVWHPGNADLIALPSRIEGQGRTMTFMAFRLLAFLGLLLGLVVPAHAQEVSSADRAAIRDIIQSQVEAFRRDDGDAAFGYASPSIRGLFGTSEIFMDMVRQGYQPVYRPRVFDFREIVTLHGQVTQKVHVVGPDGRPVTAFYPMTQLPDGSWRIDGCYLQTPEEHQA